LTNADILSLATGVNEAGDRMLLAGTDRSGVFVSTHSGVSWVAVNGGLPNLAVTALATDGTNLFAATGAGVFRRPLAEMIAP